MLAVIRGAFVIPGIPILKALALGAAFSVMVALLGSCDLTDPPNDRRLPAADPVVSDVHPAIGPSGAVSMHLAGGAASVLAAGGVESGFVYIGLAPRAVPAGLTATIRNLRMVGAMTVTMRDGGFDPIPVAAAAGDTLLIEVRRSGAPMVSFKRVVPPSRRPRVVRTSPTRGKAGVPLNMNIRMVFSEPIDRTTLTPGNVRLTRGGLEVAGVVRLVDSTGWTAAFVPTVELSPFTEHRLEITNGVRDMQGQPLERSEVVEFTTGDTLVGRPAMIRLSPDTVEMTTPTYQMTAVVLDFRGNELIDEPIVWSAEGNGGITISASGVVSAFGVGEFTVFARSGQLTATALVRVTATAPPAELVLSPAPAVVALQDTLLLTATLHDASGRGLNADVAWTSSDPEVAVVTRSQGSSRNAAVLPVSTGSVTITGAAGGLTASAVVNVTPPRQVASIELAPVSLSVLASVPSAIDATLRDASGRRIFARTLAWATEDASIAKVDANGTVTGAQSGSTRVTVTVEGVAASVPVTVSTLSFTSVTTGDGHSCALDTAGTAYCWGALPGACDESGPLPDCLLFSTVPVPVPGGMAFTSLAAGRNVTCGLTPNKLAYCWGLNNLGMLGAPWLTRSLTPVPVSGGRTFASLAASALHICGITPEGAAFCWGSNAYGQLGAGLGGPGNRVSSIPVAVTGNHLFTALSVGEGHTCGITTGGAAYCWGRNEAGELGNGSVSLLSETPVPVAGGLTFSSIAASNAVHQDVHTCGVTTSGDAYCWGSNNQGQLGSRASAGTERISPVPTRVDGGHSFASVSAGYQYTCGVATTGSVYCWGSNLLARLGDGSGGAGPANPFDFQPEPVLVAGAVRFSSVDAAMFHTCGMNITGIAYCWGSGAGGRVGNGSTAIANTPVKVGGQP